MASESLRQGLAPGILVGIVLGGFLSVLHREVFRADVAANPELYAHVVKFEEELRSYLISHFVPLLLAGPLLHGISLLLVASMFLLIHALQRQGSPRRKSQRVERMFERLVLFIIGPVNLGGGAVLLFAGAIYGESGLAWGGTAAMLLSATLLWYWPSLRPVRPELIVSRRWLAQRLERDPPLWWLWWVLSAGQVSLFFALWHDSPFHATTGAVLASVLTLTAISLGYAWLFVALLRTIALRGGRPAASCG